MAKKLVILDDNDLLIIQQLIQPQVEAAKAMLNLSRNLEKAEDVQRPEDNDSP